MRADQHIDFVRTGLVNTQFSNEDSLLKNLSIFFGDGDIKITKKETLENGVYSLSVNIKSKPYMGYQYDRNFTIQYKETHIFNSNHYTICAIDEN